MPSTTSSRDRSRLAVGAVSGLTTIAALSATGWLAGTAARSTAAEQAQQPTPHADRSARTHARPHVVVRQRPQRTHVSVRYVQGTPAAPVGGGGTVSQPVSQPVTHTAAPPPVHHVAPAPPPAPSSGS